MDFTDFHKDGEKPKNVITPNHNVRWWAQKDLDAAESVTTVINLISQNQTSQITQMALSARLYGNVSLMGSAHLGAARSAIPTSSFPTQRVSYNVVQSSIDAVTSKMAKNRPKPLFLTSGGDYRMRNKAEKLNMFVDGIFYSNDAYKLGTEIFRDASVFGTGVIHAFNRFGKVRFERVLRSELFVDEQEAYNSEPRQIHRVKNVDRQMLVEMFPDFTDEINKANAAKFAGSTHYIADQVTVRESWHLKSSPDAKDGKHLFTIENATLLNEEYDQDFFPFAFFHWSKGLFGFWGTSAAQSIQAIQLEINKILWLIQRSMHLAGTFKIWMSNGSKIVKEHLNNEIGSIIQGETKPEYLVAPIVQPEYYQHLRTLKDAAFEQVGISQLTAASQKPAGLDSGKALREYNNIESDRFMTTGQAFERLFLDLSKLAISVARDIYKEDKTYSTLFPDKNFIRTIKWSEVALEDEDFVIKAFPISSLPNDPSGRMQTVQEFAQAGWISPRGARRLMDFPDLDQAEGLANASENYLHKILEQIIEDGEYTPPEPFDDLTLARELALEYYQDGKLNNLEEEKLELLRRFINQVQIMTTPPPPPATPDATQAVPLPPPTSDLLPNIPGAA